MEPELKEYFRRIIFTISIVTSWFIINTAFGIKMGYAFWCKSFTFYNALYYAWLLFSIVLSIFLLKKIWGKPIHFDK